MNYCDLLLKHCTEHGQRRLAIELDTGREVTFDGVRERVQRLAAHFASRGIGPGSSVAIHLYNSIDCMVVHMAVQWVGARSCFVDALIQPKALGYYLEITGAALLVSRCTQTELSALDAGVDVLYASEVQSVSYSDSVPAATLPFVWPEDGVSYVYFTSGTTSEPKGVMLTGANHANFTEICTAYWQPVDESAKHLCFVPFSHGFGTIFLVPLAIRTQSELYILRAFHPLRVFEAIERHGITHLYGVPSHYQQLLRVPDPDGHLRKLQMAFCAAAKLEHALMLQWQAATGNVLCEGYGLIETCCGITWRVGTPSRGTGDMGPCPSPSLVELAILGESDQPVAAGETGQIAVRGRSVMAGYLERPEETAKVMRNGWFLTGDKGHITPDGQLFMTGRIKDLINIAGIKVSPYEVEAVLLKHSAVAEVAVVPVADALYGEVVKAYVRLKPSVEVVERDLIRFAAEHLMSFQVPKTVEFLEVFPVNAMGKLDRQKLRAWNPT